MSRFRFVEDHHRAFGVKRLCRILRVSRSGFYRWRAAAPVREARRDIEDRLAARIAEVHVDSGGAYGAPRVHAELRAAGEPVNRKRVARIMRQRGITGRCLRKRRKTTIADPAAAPVPDLLRRDFSVGRADQRWCGDVTYLPVGGRWMYLASVLDIGSRRLLGYSMAEHMRAELVIDALDAAVRARGGQVDGVVFHSDRGAQYTSQAFARACDTHGVRRSMGAVGSSADNALAESWFATLKRELAHENQWFTERQARRDVLRWTAFYNHRRRHSALGMLSPVEYENRSTTLATAA